MLLAFRVEIPVRLWVGSTHSTRSSRLTIFLALSELRNQESGISGHGVDLLIPQMLDQSATPLQQFQTPIRQICFAGNPYHNEALHSRLAVRTAGETSIFKVVRNRAIYTKRAKLAILPLVTIKPSTLIEHVDVTFNPYYDKQFATVDRKGFWKIWDIDGVYDPFRASGLKLNNSASGRVTSGDEAIGDDWGRVTWGADLNTIFVADRRKAAMFDIRVFGAPFCILISKAHGYEKTNSALGTVLDLPVSREHNCLVDFQRTANDTGHEAFLLSTKHLTWVDVRQPGRTLLDWEHYRHKNDLSMYLETFQADTITTAIIGSRINHLATGYQFSSFGNQDPVPTFLNDPFLVSSPHSPAAAPTEGALSMRILPCSIGSAASQSEHSVEDQDAQFFLGLSLSRELGITQRIYSSKKDVAVQHSRPKPLSKELLNNLPGSDLSDGANEAINWPLVPVRKYNSEKFILCVEGHNRTDFQSIYQKCFVDNADSLRTAQENTRHSVEAFTQKLTERLERRHERGDRGISTLLELRQPAFLFPDLATLETSLSTILTSPTTLETHTVLPLLDPSAPGPPLGYTNPPSLPRLYTHLLATHVTPLLPTLPPKLRLRRERLSRLIATDLFLASHGVATILPPPEIPTQPKPAPVPSSPTSSPTSSHPPSSSAPTSSRPNPLNLPAIEPVEPLKKLRDYAWVKTRILLNPGLQNVLGNWKIGENPWEVRVAVDAEEGVARVDKPKESRRKKKKRDGKASQSQSGQQQSQGWPGSSQLPPMLGMGSSELPPQLGFGSSQPPALGRGSSQVWGSSQVPRLGGGASQGMGGAFGSSQPPALGSSQFAGGGFGGGGFGGGSFGGGSFGGGSFGGGSFGSSQVATGSQGGSQGKGKKKKKGKAAKKRKTEL